MTGSELIAAISPSLADAIFDSAHAKEREVYKSVVAAVAQARKVRPVFVERQPRGERHAFMRATLSRPALALVADSLIRSWLLTQHSGLLKDFLDALKIPHENGVVEDLPKTVDDAPLHNAVEALLQKYPAETVSVYLHAFNHMNESKWVNLDTMLNNDARLDLLKPGT